MLKGYIRGWKERERCEERHLVDYFFDSHAENAATWESEQEAQNDCVIFERHQIVIPSSQGGTHVLSGFKVEQRADGNFVVFCMGPFMPQAKGKSSVS